MLQKLNERIQGVVAWLVIILIAITFTLFGVDYYLQSHQTSNVKALVNDVPLTNMAFDANYRRARAQQDLDQMTAAAERKLQAKVLEQMIANQVTVQAAHKYGFEVSVNQANNAIIHIPQFQEDGHFSKERYQHTLSSALFTPDTFQKEVRQGMLLNQQRFAFMSGSFALPSEIKRFVKLYMQTRDYAFLIIPVSHFEQQAKISEAQIKDYYESHKSDFLTPEQLSLSYVTLSMQAIRDKIVISKEDIKHYYDENQSNYLTPAQWKVSHILYAVPAGSSKEQEEQIKNKAKNAYESLKENPARFNTLVKSSDDKLSIATKGELPWLTAGQTDYDEILSDLNKPGQISPPAKTKFGYEIFMLVDFKPVSSKSFSDVEDVIKDQLLTEKAQAEYARSLEQLTDLSYQTPDSLQPVADALNVTIHQSKPFSRSGGNEDLTKNKQIINTAFSHDVLELGNNSDPVQLNNDSVAVIRVNKHFVAKQQSLKEVAARIRTALIKHFAEEKAKETGSHFLSSVDNTKQQEIIKQNQLKWVSVSQASRDNETSNAIINELAFNLTQPGSRDGVLLQNGDYAVVKLVHINDGKLNALDKEQKDSLVQQIEASYGMMDYDLYVNSLINNAQIERH